MSQYSFLHFPHGLRGVDWKSTTIVIFGPKDKLKVCMSACSFVTEVKTCGTVNKYTIASSIKKYIESNLLNKYNYDPKRIYIVNDITEEEYWEFPEKNGIDPYLSKLEFLDPSVVKMHEKFGCGTGCTVTCDQCRSQYKKCDDKVANNHALRQSGLCLNIGCLHQFYLCQQSRLRAHEATHLPPCEFCGTKRGQCQNKCLEPQCGRSYCCYSAGCEYCNRLKCDENISWTTCPICFKILHARAGLVAHFIHCTKNISEKEAAVFEKCQCGLVIMDEEHKKHHTTGKKKCKLFAAPHAPAPAPKKKYKDTLLYCVPTPALGLGLGLGVRG